MRTATFSRALFVVPLLCPPLLAQATGKEPLVPGQVKEAAVAREPRELSFHVTGLAKENLEGLRASVAALATLVYVCETCASEQASAGTCTKCQGALIPEKLAMFQKVEPSPESGKIVLKIEPRATVRLSELETALSKGGVQIDDERFPITGRAQLLVRGPLADAAPALEKALLEAKLFEEVKAGFDTARNALVLSVRAGAKAPARAKVTAVLESAQAQLVDIVWSPLPVKS